MSELPKTKSIGRVSIVPQEEYKTATQYHRLDVVSYNGGSYLAKQDAYNIIPTNTDYWLCLAEHGTPSDAQVTTAVNAWLNSNITATVEDTESILLDRSLSSNGAAAPADLAGNTLETSTLYSSIMGYRRTSESAGKTFDIQYNNVKIITTGTSTAWRGVNLFGTPAVFAVATDTLENKLAELEFYSIDSYQAANYNLNITIQWEQLSAANGNYIYAVTKNNDTGIVSYASLGTDATAKIRSWNLFNLLPIKENGNFALAVVCRNSLYSNSFTYKLEYIENTKDYNNSYYFDIMGTGTTQAVNHKYTQVAKNKVKLVSTDTTNNDSTYNIYNLFGDVKRLPAGDNYRDSSLKGLDVYPLNFKQIEDFDLIMTIIFDKLYSGGTNDIYLITKNEETEEVTYKLITSDKNSNEETYIKKVNLCVSLPEIRKNGNFALAVESKWSTHPNEFTYILNHERRVDNTLTKKYNFPSAAVVGDMTKVSKIDFIKNKRIVTSGSTVDTTAIVTVEPTTTVQWNYAIIGCTEGDCFTISGQGGTDPRLYCFVDDSESQTQAIPLQVAGIQEHASEKLIIAPKNATKLIINVRFDEDNTEDTSYCYKGVTPYKSWSELLEFSKEKTLFFSEMGKGTSESSAGKTFVINKNYVQIQTTGTSTAFRACQLLGQPSVFTTASEWESYYNNAYSQGQLCFYPIDFDMDNKDLCIQVFFDNITDGSYNAIYIVSKDMETGVISRSRITNDNCQSARINLNEIFTKLKINKNFQLVVEAMNSAYPNSFYYILSFKDKQITDEITDGIIRPADYYFQNSYITNRATSIINNFDNMSKSFFKNDIFIWITDPHYWSGYRFNQFNGLQSTKLIKYLIQQINIPRVFCGGDLARGTMKKNDYLALLKRIKSHLNLILDKTYMIIANHEWNNPASETEQEPQEVHSWQLYPLILKDKEDQYKSVSPKMDYYIDNSIQKVRYFCIGCAKNSSLFPDTIFWLAKQLELVPDDYTVVIFSHIGIIDTTGEFEYHKNFTEIVSMLDAARNQTTYTYSYNGSSQTSNYSNFNATIACVLSGHCHQDGHLITNTGIPIIATVCDMAARPAKTRNGLIRKLGTIGEQAFDVVQLDLENRKIYLTRIGGSYLGARYDVENDAIIDEADYDADTDTIAPDAIRYDANSWVIYSPYKDRVFSY